MKKTKLLRNIPKCKAPTGSSEEVQAVSQVVEHEGKQILNIDLYYMGECKGRYFADKEEPEYAANINGKWYSCRMDNTVRLCKGLDALKGSCYYIEKWEFETKEAERTALDYLGVHYFESFEHKVKWGKEERAYKRKCKRIDDIMSGISCVPDEMKEWLKQTVFPEKLLFFKKDKKRTNYSCTECGSKSWKKNSWKHGEMTICPKCKKEVKAYSRKQERTQKTPVILLQTHGEEWVERQFRAVCTWKAGEKKSVELYEEVRAIIPKGECWGKVWYKTEYDADEFGQGWRDKNTRNKRFMESYLYPGNLNEVLPYGELQNSGLDILAKNGSKLNVNKFITTFHQRPWIEYMAKSGFSNLVADIINTYGWWGDPGEISKNEKNIKAALRLDGNRINRMKQINGGLNVLGWLQYEQQRENQSEKMKISQESLQYLNAKGIRKGDCKRILEALGSVNRMVNYMKKQTVAPKSLMQTWKDYLAMAADEGMDITDDIVKLPKNLKENHDRLVEVRNEREDEKRMEEQRERNKELNRKIKKNLGISNKYRWENEKYIIVPAKSCEELMKEGQKLHHCVGSSDGYMKKMADGRSWILFLRKKDDIEKPYYTIEINTETNEILQWYAEFNRKPNEKEIKEVLKNFKNKLNKRKEKREVA